MERDVSDRRDARVTVRKSPPMIVEEDLGRSFDGLLAAAAADPTARSGLDAVARAWRDYAALLCGTAEEAERTAPEFMARVRASVAACRGVVLEIGCSLGQMTRWIAAEPAVTRVVAVDRDPAALAVLRALDLPKTAAYVPDAATPARVGRVDVLVLCELVEHVTTRDELTLLRRYAACFAPDARYVVSTPIGFMEDPDHVRGFTKTQFLEHVEGLYGPVEAVDYRAGYSQVAVGRLIGHARPYRG